MRIAKPDKTIGRAALVVIVGMSTALSASASVVVQPGDTLSDIAAENGTTVQQLVELNELADPNLLVPGMELATGLPHASDTAERTHVVKPGETLSGIAAVHGVSVETIVRANGLVDGRLLAGVAVRLSLPPVEFAASDGGGAHTIAAGETLSGIARAHGTTTDALTHANRIQNPDLIAAGTILTLPGGWRCPVPEARFSNDWGLVKPDGRVHGGIDMFAARGTAVIAPVAGIATQGTGSISGHSFTLVADDGTVYYGAHMDSAGASGRVLAGDVLGTVGDSGNAAGTSPHLHFAIEPNGGVSVNPYPTLRQFCG